MWFPASCPNYWSQIIAEYAFEYAFASFGATMRPPTCIMMLPGGLVNVQSSLAVVLPHVPDRIV